MKNLTDEMRFARFSRTVGEMQGELQHPPESLRKGRKVVLSKHQTEGAVYDTSIEMWVSDAPKR